MKKYVWVLLSVLTAASLALSACGGAGAAALKAKDSLVVINPAQPWSLDPALARDTNSLHLKSGVKFHNGNDFTAWFE